MEVYDLTDLDARILQVGPASAALRARELAIIATTDAHTDGSVEDQARLLEALQALDQMAVDTLGVRAFIDSEKLTKSYAVMAKAPAAKFWTDFYPRLTAFRSSLWDQETHGSLQAAT